MNIIENKRFDEERALYGSREILVKDCAFDGPADGESAFKECFTLLKGFLKWIPTLGSMLLTE